jgi:CRP/FNR family transcriptional regulator, cyclic AMP receptor protein
MTPEIAMRLISSSDFFSGILPADASSVLSLMKPANFANGRVIFSSGDESKGLFLVVEGRVKLSVLTEDGRELSIAHASPGDVFGEIASLDGHPRTANATTLMQTTLLFLPKPDLLRLVGSSPQLSSAIIKFLCKTLRATDHKLEAIALHSIEVRLARFLLATAQTQYREGLKSRADISLDISQGELGLLIGASRPKVNAALVALEEDGAITKLQGKIICNIAKLQRCAGLESLDDE